MSSSSQHHYPAYTTMKSAAINNNGGTVLYGGNINTNYRFPNMTQSLGSNVLGYRSGINGSIVPGPFNVTYGIDNRMVTNIVAGNYATMTQKQYIIMRYTNFIAGNASTVLNAGAADFGKRSQPNFSGLVRTQKYIMTGGWVYQTGKPVAIGFGTDAEGAEAFPTYSAPGRITYNYNGELATSTGYKSKTD